MTLLIASDPKELVASQHALIADIGTKLETAIEEARGAERMKDQMIAARLSPSQARALHKRATERVSYLIKVKTALEAGYCMMPDMPGDVIAVRVFEESTNIRNSHVRHDWRSQVPNIAGGTLPAGEGKYVSPRVRTRKVTTYLEGGKTKSQYQAAGLRDPFGINQKFMRPEVLSRASSAMMTKAFDEIVCIDPARANRRSRDPIILGRIISGKNVSAFLIAWFVDSVDI